MSTITLYTYCKSSAAYRVRIALNYKKIQYDSEYISLIKDGGQNYKAEYKELNPQAFVPTLIVEGEIFTQSLAILEYLEERYPDSPLLPTDYTSRAKVRSYTQLIACDIHPLNNLRVLKYLTDEFNSSDETKKLWYQHWITEGFTALEQLLMKSNAGAEYCIGNKLSLADVLLVPQVYNAYRFECDMGKFPIISKIYESCMKIESFQLAAPENQADYVN